MENREKYTVSNTRSCLRPHSLKPCVVGYLFVAVVNLHHLDPNAAPCTLR
eukprot:NODE_19406_length_173_cov_24.733871_g18492_i0.p2 GENE.NODE_19406_length_173_cov_24.733871_g18492_i0~~NODE_19406_length_173_cov_24.733871_g18492_i0.p2  ORF type:complete len:50 (+),score=0.16 NODE_19406_length_173_cov_24.733871_g18492_i0:17-166(+)